MKPTKQVNKERLADHTWFKIGGPAELIEPSSKAELIDIIESCIDEGRPYRILGNGSNVLISDDGLDDLIIKNTTACSELAVDGNTVTAGSAVLLPQFINFCIEHGLGGIEYLYSVPGTIGGALFMNAGRGKGRDQTISDHLVSVEIHDGEQVRTLQKDELAFKHRYSTFHENEHWTILSATFNLPSQPKEVGRQKVKERMDYISTRDRSTPNAGSVFKEGMQLPLKGVRVGGAKFVNKNRIGNVDNASATDVERLIRIAEILHRLVPFVETPEREIRIWK